MKNVSSIKSLKTESPKTPGGISKSLLTPCRRIGLSRNYKKAGPVPFISPLFGNSSTQVEVKVEKKHPRKRKKSVEDEQNEEESETSSKTSIVEDGLVDVDEGDISKPTDPGDDDLSSTPTRHVEVPRKKKSKTLLSALSKSNDVKSQLIETTSEKVAVETTLKEKNYAKVDKEEVENEIVPPKKSKSKKSPRTPKSSKEILNDKIDINTPKKDIDNLENVQSQEVFKMETDNMVTPLEKTKTKSNFSKKVVTSRKSPRKNANALETKDINSTKIQSEEKASYSIKPRSPNDLTKECIVVIQKKIFKTDKNKIKSNDENNAQAMIDSDSDDIPLNQLNKEKSFVECENKKTKTIENDLIETKTQPKTVHNELENEVINVDDENEDFVEPKKTKVKKLADKSTSIGGLKKKPKLVKAKPKSPNPILTPDDDEDDFDFDNKKTILIRKTYEKVSKPQKAKTTGSITQRDIDELKARIESKKKLLLAKAMTEDTEELRTLIKKWQKGCQDALMELMDLMKNKFPDKQNMDYSEMLSMLKIPTNLVGYDEENDCFNTPDDANIVLSNFNYL